MTSEHLIDRMPEVRHGHDAWTGADLGHLESCPECAADWRVVSAAQRVDRLPAVDVDTIVNSVLHRLRAEPVVVPLRRRAPWRMGLVGLAAAASVALVLLLRQAPPALDSAFAPSREATMLPELNELFEAELEVVLAAVTTDEFDPVGTVPRLGDLTDEELETLLEEVEG